MEVEGTSLPDPHDSKRLKTGVPLPDPPSLTSEYSFVSGVLDSCCNHEQKRFAAAYKKWIDTIVNQQRWKQPQHYSSVKLPLDAGLESAHPPVVLTLTSDAVTSVDISWGWGGVEGGLCSGFLQYSSVPEAWNQVARAHYHTRSVFVCAEVSSTDAAQAKRPNGLKIRIYGHIKVVFFFCQLKKSKSLKESVINI